MRVTNFVAQFTQREYRGWFSQQLNLNKHVQSTKIYCCFFSRMNSSIAVVLWFSNRFLFCWSQITFPHHMKWSSRDHNEFSYTTQLYKVKKHCSRDSAWRTNADSQKTNLEFCTRSCAMSKLRSLPSLPLASSIRWVFPRMMERLDFAESEIQSA